jgi:hypothetical protein
MELHFKAVKKYGAKGAPFYAILPLILFFRVLALADLDCSYRLAQLGGGSWTSGTLA